ncbi:MAG: rhomboid family intramembrane serine protease [Chitinophagales bacterium]|nr:rhomboid family intramembrane serine protease [Chitinophagales bacterium]MDW8427122.1 rhomboid family intramembrane serine protease [Chitinophagales bacterium]
MSNVLWRDIRSTLRRNDGVVYRLLLAFIVVFVLLHLARLPAFFLNHALDLHALIRPVALPAALPELIQRPWTILSYAFVHINLFHLLFNALTLFWFGKIFCEFMQPRMLFPLFLTGALLGGFIYLAAYNLLPALWPARPQTQLIGASAGVMAIMVATATLVPEYTMFLLLLGAVRIKWIALTLLVLSILALPGPNSGGQFAHLGGAVMGFVYIRLLQRGYDLFGWLEKLSQGQRRRPMRKTSERRFGAWSTSFFPSAPRQAPLSKEERLNAILDKISASGYDHLTQEEKEFLRRYGEENES